MIKKVILENFKGITGSYPLTGRDLFIGANGAGKSAIQQAAALAIQGYLPGGFKRADDVMQYAAGNTMTVGIVLANGFEARRTWTRYNKIDSKTGAAGVSIEQTIIIMPSNGETTNKDKETRIATELGAVPLMFDFNELDSMSDGKRREFIYNIANYDRSKYNLDLIKQYLVRNEHLIEDQEYKAKMLKEIEETLAHYPDSAPFEVALESLQAYATSQLMTYKAKRMEATAASRKLLEYKNVLQTTDSGISDLRAEEKETTARIEELAGEMGTQEAQIAELKRLKNDEQEAIESLQVLKNRLASDNLALAVISKEMAEAENNILLSISTVGDTAEIEKNLAQANEMLDHVKGLRNQAMDKMLATNETIKRLGGNGCPVVHGWACPHNWTEQQKILEGQAEGYRAEHEKYTKVCAGLETQAKKELDKIAAINKRLEQEQAIREEYEEAYAGLNKKMQAVEAEKKQTEEAIGRREASMATRAARIAEIGNVDTEVLETQKTLIAGYRGRREAVKEILQAKEQAKNTIVLAMQSTLEAKEADTLYNIYNNIYMDLGPKGVQGIIVKDILEPLVTKITARLQTMDKYKQHRFSFITESPTGQEVFRYGWETPAGQLILYPALSTSEKAAVVAALLTTIIEELSVKTRILLIDNLENFDEGSRCNFLAALQQIGGKYDNIIAAGVLADKQIQEAGEIGFNVWEL